MAKTAKVTVGLPDELSAAVEAAIKSGDYEAVSDVVRDALHLLKAGRAEPGLSEDVIGRLWDAGIASGRAASLG